MKPIYISSRDGYGDKKYETDEHPDSVVILDDGYVLINEKKVKKGTGHLGGLCSPMRPCGGS